MQTFTQNYGYNSQACLLVQCTCIGCKQLFLIDLYKICFNKQTFFVINKFSSHIFYNKPNTQKQYDHTHSVFHLSNTYDNRPHSFSPSISEKECVCFCQCFFFFKIFLNFAKNRSQTNFITAFENNHLKWYPVPNKFKLHTNFQFSFDQHTYQ